MLVIRETQMRAFDEALGRQFENQLVGWLEDDHLDRYIELGPEGSLEFVRGAIELTRSHGFESRQTVKRFVELLVRYEDWLGFSGPTAILADRSMSGDCRMELLWFEITGQFPEE